MKQLINFVMRMFHFFVPYSFLSLWNKASKVVYTAWVKNEFKQTGDISIEKGLRLVGGKSIIIGNKTGFGKNGILQAWHSYKGDLFTPSLIIGDNCWIGDYFNISAINSITVGNGVLMGRWVTILDNAHGKTDYTSLKVPPCERRLYTKSDVKIDNNVWIGDKVTILPGVHIGEGAVIGANSVVTKDIPAYSVAAGIPAKVIKVYGI